MILPTIKMNFIIATLFTAPITRGIFFHVHSTNLLLLNNISYCSVILII